MSILPAKDHVIGLSGIVLILIIMYGCSNSGDSSTTFSVKINPDNNSIGVPAVPRIEARFNENINVGTLTSNDDSECDGSFQLSIDGFQTCVPTTQVYQNESDEAVFYLFPKEPLDYNRYYEVEITTDVSSASGGRLSQAMVVAFTVSASSDSTPPSVDSLTVYPPTEFEIPTLCCWEAELRWDAAVDNHTAQENLFYKICSESFFCSSDTEDDLYDCLAVPITTVAEVEENLFCSDWQQGIVAYLIEGSILDANVYRLIVMDEDGNKSLYPETLFLSND